MHAVCRQCVPDRHSCRPRSRALLNFKKLVMLQVQGDCAKLGANRSLPHHLCHKDFLMAILESPMKTPQDGANGLEPSLEDKVTL